MAQRDNGGQAFPVPAGNFSGESLWQPVEGMTLRDYFAAQIAFRYFELDSDYSDLAFAKTCYRVADALLKARAISADEPIER